MLKLKERPRVLVAASVVWGLLFFQQYLVRVGLTIGIWAAAAAIMIIAGTVVYLDIRDTRAAKRGKLNETH